MGLDELQERLRGFTIVGLDAVTFIYHFEDNETYAPLTQLVFEEVEAGRVQAVVSVLTVAEILTGAKRGGNEMLLFQYRHVFASFPNLTVVPIDMMVAERASDLRVAYNLRTPDALSIATALVHGAQGMITNDRGLQRVRDLHVVVLGDHLNT